MTNTPKTPTCLMTPARSFVRTGLLAAAMLLGACDESTDADSMALHPSTEMMEEPMSPRSSGSCGDGVVQATELCDDGNLVDDDGCDSTCQPSGIATVGTGDGTSCAVTLAGHVECWGRNEYGQLGRGDVVSIGDDETPASAGFVALGGPASEIYTNGEQTLALMKDGTVRAWGHNDSHQLGLGHDESIGDDETPASATISTDVPLGGPTLQLAVGSDFACARSMQGTVRCWGANDFGQLGLGHTERVGDDETLTEAADVALVGPALDITAGAHHACAVVEGGLVQCWGLGRDGQLGYGNVETIGDDESPIDVGPVDVGGVVIDVEAGGLHTCARLDSGMVRCWGDAAAGQLGYGELHIIGDDEAPSAAGDVDVGGFAVDIAAGWDHTCAVLDDGGLRCWGSADRGQLGLGHTATVGDDESPAAAGIVDLGSDVALGVFIGSSSRSTCVVLDGGRLRCWGDNDAGQLGQGHTLLLGDDPSEGGGDLPDIIVIGDDDDS